MEIIMSFYKEQLQIWLADKDFKSGRVLGIGWMNDDMKYFKSAKYNEFVTMDIDPEMKPDIVGDLNEEFIFDL